MDEKQLQLLYNDYAKNKGFKDYSEFKDLMSVDDNRKMFFDESNKELGFKDFNEFNDVIGVKKKDGSQISGTNYPIASVSPLQKGAKEALQEGAGLADNSFLRQINSPNPLVGILPKDEGILPSNYKGLQDVSLKEIRKERKEPKSYYNAPLEKGVIFTGDTEMMAPGSKITEEDAKKLPLDVTLKNKFAQDYIEKIRKEPTNYEVEGSYFDPSMDPMGGIHLTIAQNAIDQFISKAAELGSGVTSMFRDVSSLGIQNPELYDKEGKLTEHAKSLSDYKNWINDPAGAIMLGLNGIKSDFRGDLQYNGKLPNTMFGKLVSGGIGIIPDIAGAALLPETELFEGAGLLAKAGKFFTKKFPLYLGGTRAIGEYGEEREAGKTALEAGIGALKGAAKGYGEGLAMELAGILSGKATGAIMKPLEKMGITGLKGQITKEGLNTITDAIGYGALVPLASGFIEGKIPTEDEYIQGVGLSLPFSVMRIWKNATTHAQLNDAIDKIEALQAGVSLSNFVDATTSSIVDVYNGKETAAELNLKSLEFAKKARETTDLKLKQDYIMQSSAAKKAANVKQIAETVINDKNGFKEFKESNLPEDIKQSFLDKAAEVYKELNPTEQQKTELGKRITQAQTFVDEMTKQMEAETDPVKKAELKYQIDETNKLLEKQNTDLTDIIAQQAKERNEYNKPEPEDADNITKKVRKPSQKKIQKDIDSGNLVSFTFADESDIPEAFKDKITSSGETNGIKYVRVTVAKSLADYELSKIKDTANKIQAEPTEIAGLKVIRRAPDAPSGEPVYEVEGGKFLTEDGKQLKGLKKPKSIKKVKPTKIKEVKKTTSDIVAEDLLSHLGIEADQNKPKFQLEKSGKIEPKMPKKLGKGATKEQKLKYAKDLEKYAKDKALYDQDVEAVNQANKEVAGIFDRAEIEQQQSTDEPVSIDVSGAADVPTQKIEVSETDKRPEAGVMSKLSIKMGDWIKGAKVALGMSDTLRTGDREVTELDKNGNKVTKTIRDEGGIGFPFKSFIDLINGKIEAGKKAMGWAAVGEGAGTSMLNAAKKSKKITGAELKEHYYKNLNLTPEQKQRLNEAIPDDKEYGLVTIYKMGEEGIRSNEAFAKEAFRLMDVKLTDAEKANAFKLAEDRLDKIEWGKEGVKEKYIGKLKAAKTFEELEAILNGEGSDMSLGTKAEIMQKIFLGTEKTTSTENVNPLSALLKEKGISIEGISRTLEEPIMSNIDAGQPMILLAIDPTSKVVKDTQRHANYSYGVEGFPIGLFNETSQMHHLSPEMMDTYVKTATTSVDENVAVRGSKEKARISISHDRNGNYTAELGKGATKVQFTDKKGVFTKSDGKFYDSNGKPIKETANILSFKSKEEINNELKKLGYTVSEASNEPYTQDISGTNISNLMQKAKAGIISFFEDPKVTAQQKLVKYINKAFPNIDISLDPEAYRKIEEDFRNKKLLNVGQKTFGVVDSQTGKIYLNPEVLNNNTPIHELGHVWNIYAKQYKPEIYNKGLELITDPKNSTYLDSVLNNTKYQKLIKDAFGNDALIKNRETGDYEINKNHSKFNDINEYVADEALAKAIGDKGELFVNESQKRNFEKFLETLYSAIKQVLGFEKYSNEEFQNLKLNDFVNAAVKDILGGKEVSKISSNELAELTKDITLPKFQLEGGQDSKIKEFIEIQREKGISDDDIKAGLEKVADKIGIDKNKIDELLSKEITKVSGIKNVLSEKTRTQLNLPSIDIPNLGTKTNSLLEGKRLVDSGEINPEELVDRILNTTDKGTNTQEAQVMQYYTRQLNTAQDNVINALADEKITLNERLDLLGKLGQFSDRLDQVTEANILSGGDWGLVGNIRQEVYDEGYNPVKDRAAIKQIYGGKIPDNIKVEIDKANKERDEALIEMAKREEIIKQQEAQLKIQEVSKTKVGEKIDHKKVRADLIAELKEAKDEHLKKLGNKGIQQMGGVEGIVLTPKMIKIIGKIAADYVKEGYENLEDVISKVYDEVKGFIPNISKKDIRDSLVLHEAGKIEEKATKAEKQAEKYKKEGVPSKSASRKLKEKFESDDAWVKSRQRLSNANKKIQQIKSVAYNSKKNIYEKTLLWITKALRAGILSSYGVVVKLASAIFTGGIIKRIPEQAIGMVYSKVYKGIAEKAPIEGFVYGKSEVKFVEEFFNPKKLAKNTWQILKEGQSDLSKRVGDMIHEDLTEITMPGEQKTKLLKALKTGLKVTDMILSLPSNSHMMIKDPLKRATYYASYENALIWAEKNGLDINDPLVINTIETAAYKRANYEIFLEDNALNRKFKKWKNEQGATIKALVDFVIPISTVPTNIVRRVFSTSPLGLAKGIYEAEVAKKAIKKSIDNLETEQADAIMRQLKQGTLGTALWMLGWFGYASFGGLYTKFDPNKKREEGDLLSDEMEINGIKIPKPVQHAVPLEVIQMAATARRIYENYVDNKGVSSTTALTAAALGSIGSMAEQVPVIATPVLLAESIQEPSKFEKIKEDYKTRFQPRILQQLGIVGDSDEEKFINKHVSGDNIYKNDLKAFDKRSGKPIEITSELFLKYKEELGKEQSKRLKYMYDNGAVASNGRQKPFSDLTSNEKTAEITRLKRIATEKIKDDILGEKTMTVKEAIKESKLQQARYFFEKKYQRATK
jgi:hypothetical protein